MDPLAIFNLCEAFLWFFIAAFFFFRAASGNGLVGKKKVFAALGVILVFFGASDLIEMKTGAWWRPEGLLALKAACVIGLVLCLFLVYGAPPVLKRWISFLATYLRGPTHP